jgi:ribosomal-protein-alanine N-acetyltransferase
VEVAKVCLPHDAWSEKSIEYAINHMEDTNYRYILLVATNELDAFMGFIMATVVAEDCEICDVAVDIPYRRKHVAESLFNQLESAISGIASSIYLEVRKSNTSAQSLYLKLGFQVVGERKHYYDYPREDAILMVKALE